MLVPHIHVLNNTQGVFFAELLHNFERFQLGKEMHKLKFYVGHDGSMIRLAAGLGLGSAANGGTLRWPAMGSEIVMEVSRCHKPGGPCVNLLRRSGAIRAAVNSSV